MAPTSTKATADETRRSPRILSSHFTRALPCRLQTPSRVFRYTQKKPSIPLFPTDPLTIFRRCLLYSLWLTTLSIPLRGETFVHQTWHFRVELPDGWIVLSEGGLASEPVAFSIGGRSAESVLVHRLPRSAAGTGRPTDSETTDSAIRRIAEGLGEQFSGLTGVHSYYLEGESIEIDTSAGIATEHGFRHLLMRTIFTANEIFVLSVSVAPTGLESMTPVVRRVFDSFEHLDARGGPAGRFWFVALVLGVVLGVASLGWSARRGPLGPTSGRATWFLVAIIAMAFPISIGWWSQARAEKVTRLQEIERLEHDYPGISRSDYLDPALRADYREARQSYRARFIDESRIGLRVDRPSPVSLVVYPLLHASWSHLIWNLFFVFLCGRLVERSAGSVVVLSCFVLGATAAAMGHWWWHPQADLLIGASGGASALLGAALVFRFWAPIGPRFLGARIELSVPMGVIALAWIANQLWQGIAMGASAALALHLSGFAFGIALALAVRVVSASTSVVPPRAD